MRTFLTILGTTAAIASAADPGRWKLKVSMEDYTTHYFENQVDHFNAHDERTYEQRYWYNDKFFNKDDGPVFLYICGEWTCTPPDTQMFPMMVGADHDALLVSLEHRYYGDSQPFDNWSVDNLDYLTSEQALADIAAFIDGQNEVLGRKADWIVIGGSYPGALSAWFKSQYPDHAVGAWSSSGVIHAIEDFKAFDLDIFMRADDSSPDCSNAIAEAIAAVEHQFETETGTQQIAGLFGITIPIDKRDFWFYFADIFVTGVQYGSRISMCESLTSNDDTPAHLLQAVAELGKNEGLSYDQYDATALADTTIDINKNLRQWTYQYCNEFGFFQTPNEEHPMRSEALRLDFWPDYCKRIFGREIETKTDDTNRFYGGLNIKGDNIFFLNGSEDPWQYAAMRELRHPYTTQKTMGVAYIECDTCAHCVDFHTPEEGQPESLTNAQHAIADEVAKWLTEAQEKREAVETASIDEPNWQDIDYEQKRLDTNEQVLEGDGTQIFLQ